jgi:hypothetical protein
LSDFHEMATHLRMQEERSLLLETHIFMVNTNGRQSGIGRRHFSYSDLLTEKSAEINLSLLSDRKTGYDSDT